MSLLLLFTVCLMVVFGKVLPTEGTWSVRHNNVTSTSAHIEFTPLIHANQFTLIVFDSFKAKLPDSQIQLMEAQLYFLLTNLRAGEKYVYHLCKTVIKEHEKNYCIGKTQSFRTNPFPPLGFSNISHSETEFLIDWLPPPENCTYSHFVISINEPTKSKLLPYHVRQTVFRNLTPGKLYTITLRTASGDILSEPLTKNYRTIPYPPSNMSITLSNSTLAPGLKVDWTDPSFGEFDKFVLSVQYGTLGSKITINHDWMYEFDKEDHTKIFYDLELCQYYRFVLQAISANRESHPVFRDIKTTDPKGRCKA